MLFAELGLNEHSIRLGAKVRQLFYSGEMANEDDILGFLSQRTTAFSFNVRLDFMVTEVSVFHNNNRLRVIEQKRLQNGEETVALKLFNMLFTFTLSAFENDIFSMKEATDQQRAIGRSFRLLGIGVTLEMSTKSESVDSNDLMSKKQVSKYHL